MQDYVLIYVYNWAAIYNVNCVANVQGINEENKYYL